MQSIALVSLKSGVYCMACNSVRFSFFSQLEVLRMCECAWVCGLHFSLARRQSPCKKLNQQLHTNIHYSWPVFDRTVEKNQIKSDLPLRMLKSPVCILNAECQNVQSEQLVLGEFLLFFAFQTDIYGFCVRLPTSLYVQSFMPVIYYSYATHDQKNWFQHIEFKREKNKRTKICVLRLLLLLLMLFPLLVHSFSSTLILFGSMVFVFLWFWKVYYTQPYNRMGWHKYISRYIISTNEKREKNLKFCVCIETKWTE